MVSGSAAKVPMEDIRQVKRIVDFIGVEIRMGRNSALRPYCGCFLSYEYLLVEEEVYAGGEGARFGDAFAVGGHGVGKAAFEGVDGP